MEQRSQAWYQARAGRITGSRFARAMASKNTDAYRGLIDELAQERRTGRSQDGGYVNSAMQWGIDHESGARQWYGRLRACEVVEAGFVVHPEHDFVGVSPDGLVSNDGLIEIKCPQATTFRQVADSRKMPPRYRWQVQGQLWVCRRQWLDFVCFYPPAQGIVIRILASQGDFDQLDARCREINREVEKRVGARRMVATPVATTMPSHSPVARATSAASPEAVRRSAPQPPPRAEPSGLPGWVWLLLLIVGLYLLLLWR